MTKSTLTSEHLQSVREQYEDYPYPARDPEDEKKRLYATVSDGLNWINHYCYEGKRDFSKGYRVLVAGGGTGDTTVYMAEQLRRYDAEIVYIDLSQASMKVAQERLKMRGLENVTWIHDSLLNIPNLDLGEFDYISCTGVLHHLKDPDLGLRILSDSLKDDGVMSIMVYGQYGRTAIYQMQELMRRIAQNIDHPQKKVDMTRAVLEQLPRQHWQYFGYESIKEEISTDIGLYDLYLHSQDRAYTVPQLYEFVEQAGLEIAHFFGGDQKWGERSYDPAAYLKEGLELKEIKKLPDKEQQAIAELLNGRISRHVFYATKQPAKKAELKNLDNVPAFDLVYYGQTVYQDFYELVRQSKNNFGMRDVKTNHMLSFKKTPHIEYIVQYMDGERSLKEIFAEVRKQFKAKDKPHERVLLAEFRAVYEEMERYRWLYLRHKSIPQEPDTDQMIKRVNDLYKE